MNDEYKVPMKINGALKGEIILTREESERYEEELIGFCLMLRLDKYGRKIPDCFNLVQVPSRPTRELKTVKDFNFDNVNYSLSVMHNKAMRFGAITARDRIRLEAKRWIKHYYTEAEIWHRPLNDMEKHIIDWIKHFFNVKEEELTR